MFSLNSSNPAIHNEDAFNPYQYRDEGAAAVARPATASLQGVVNKTSLLVGIAVVTGTFGYWLLNQLGWGVIMMSCLVGFITTMVAYFVIARKPAVAMVLGPIYAAVEGVFLGALTAGLEAILAAKIGATVAGGLALQAFIVTIGITCAMLALYSLRIIQPTRRFTAVVATLTLGAALAYGLSWILWLFGVQLPFVTLGSAMEGGTPALIGLGINVVFLVIASLGLIIDFGEVEERINSGAPKASEWYCAFALMVTLAWIYYEAVKIIFRVAMLVNNRN